MRKNYIISIVVILVIAVIGGGIFVFTKANNEETVAPVALDSMEKQPLLPSSTEKQYEDESGFKFRYPDNFDIKVNELDDKTYADLELTSKDATGSIAIKVTDTKIDSLDEWVKDNESEVDSSTVKDVDFADISAKEIESEDKILLVSLDQGALFAIRTTIPQEKEFWKNSYQKVISTFEFYNPAKNTGSAGNSSAGPSDIIFEGEEIIE